MSGSPLSVYNDFANNTGPAIFTGAQDLVNEVSKRNYLLGKFLVEDEMGEHVSGGERLKDTVLADAASTFTFYQPNSMFTWQNPQVTKDWEIHWRFAMDHMSWTEQEILFQINSGMTRKARFQKYKDIMKIKEARLWTSIMNGMENHLFAIPSNAEMEQADGLQPYSLPALINESANGLHTGFTTLQNINPTTDSYWKPRQVQYDFADPDDTDGDGDGIFNAFDEMDILLKFTPPPKGTEHFEKEIKSRLIATSKGGKLLYQRLLRTNGDRGYVSNPQDPSYTMPKFAGVDIHEVDTLEDAALYDDGSSGFTDWASATTAGPRFYFVNTRYVRMVFHEERYFHKHPVKDHPNQIGSFRQPVAIWYQLFCRSRQRGTGIVYPGA